MKSRTWDELRASIRELAREEEVFRLRHTPITIKWGILTLEAEKIGHTVTEVAAEGGQSEDYIETARDVVAAWTPKKMPDGVAFSIFEDLIRPTAQARLGELGMTKEQFLTKVMNDRASAGGRVRVDDVRKALGLGVSRVQKKDRVHAAARVIEKDPASARDLISNPKTRHAISAAIADYAQSEASHRERSERASAPGLTEADDFNTAGLRLDQAESKLDAAIELLSRVAANDRNKKEVLEIVDRIEQKLAFLRSWAEGGRIADALETMLERG